MLNKELLQKLDFFEKTFRLFLINTFQFLWKTLRRFRRNQFKCWIGLILAAYFSKKLSIYIEYRGRAIHEFNKVIHYIPHGQQHVDPYVYILEWNSDTNNEDQATDLDLIKCEAKNCIFTKNRRLLPSLTDFNAVMIDVGSSNGRGGLPRLRKKEQIYIMADEESPTSTKHNLKFQENFFNMTFTYRRDSDVQWTHARFYDIDMNNFVSISRQVKWRKPSVYRAQDFISSIKTTKSPLSAWFVSNCNSSSSRELLAQKLQTYMNVDIYGECGNFTCTNLNPEKCVDMPSSSYKFYFAFETSPCVDYITENVFLSMQNNQIPIIFNGVTDMQHFLPPNSYINVNDFNSIKKLVKYLKFLDENPQEFANYFWWKKHYKLVMYSKAQAYCDICMSLNDWDPRMKMQQYKNVDNWFHQKSCKGKLKEL